MQMEMSKYGFCRGFVYVCYLNEITPWRTDPSLG